MSTHGTCFTYRWVTLCDPLAALLRWHWRSYKIYFIFLLYRRPSTKIVTFSLYSADSCSRSSTEKPR